MISSLVHVRTFGSFLVKSNTNLSTSISLTLLDEDGNDLSLHTPVELLIPRDPTAIIPPMFFQNVTSLSASPHHQLFNLHYVDLSAMSDASVHLELHPLSVNLSYLLIYRFDRSPVLNTSLQEIDGWLLFCPASKRRKKFTFFRLMDLRCHSDLFNRSLYTLFIDNHRTLNHRSVIFGLRELNATEMNNSCSKMDLVPLTNERFHFTFNYELRLFTSACYYLDANDQWRSDGMTVGPLTNHYETQCFSTRLN